MRISTSPIKRALVRTALLPALAFLLSLPAAFAQQTYSAMTTDAFARYEAKEYRESAALYEKAFKTHKKVKPSATDYYNAACSWALAGNKKAALSYLNKSVDAGWGNLRHFTTDADLKSLHNEKQWKPLVARLTAEIDKRDAHLNKPLKKELEDIMALDQGVRMKIDSVQKNFGMKSPEWQALMTEMARIDEQNTARVIAIIEQHGWPGKSLVGSLGSQAAFLVIQHAELPVQVKYFPMMKEAAEKGELAKSSVAMLEDRIRMRNGLKQLYGSQLQHNEAANELEFYPIEDEPNVDKRRAEVGLGPLSEYAKHFGLDYKVPASQ